jgi:Spx/MgsR family transcriptional regulator
MRVDLYGLKNCDGCRKASKALQARDLVVEFHDIRDRSNTARVVAWIADQADWSAFVNRRSTTWRNLDPAERDHLDKAGALTLLTAHPTLIKRPVLRIGRHCLAGFDNDAVTAALQS